MSSASPPEGEAPGARRIPRWAPVAAGLVIVMIGAVLTLRPFTSLSTLVILVGSGAVATGIGELLSAGHTAAPRVTAVVGAAWILLGVAVLVWPGLGVTGLAVLVGIALAVAGGLRIVDAVRGSLDHRATAVISGLAGIVFGVLALSWPDVTVLVVAVLFGARTLLFGLTLIGAGLRGGPDDVRDAAKARAPRTGSLRRTVTAVLSLVVALVLLTVSVWMHDGSPSPDAFYAAPASVPASPGALLRSEPFTTAIPDGARAWRILYTTTTQDGTPALASAVVVEPTVAATGPRPVIAWAHGTTGFATGCAPSLLDDPFTAGALPALDRIIDNGWVLVATDYTGLGTEGPHPYLVGEGEARSVLDAVRAARRMGEPRMADRTVVWGHSQGGHAALWTGQIAAAYAPDVRLAGVAALAPASDLTGLARELLHVQGGPVFASYILAAYDAVYDDVAFDDYVRPGAVSVMRAYSRRCLAEPQMLISVMSTIVTGSTVFSGGFDRGGLPARLRENTPMRAIPAPLLIAQGTADNLVVPAVQDAYVTRRCGLGGGPLDYRTYASEDHVGVIAADSPLIPDLLAWTGDRIAGAAAHSSCVNGKRRTG